MNTDYKKILSQLYTKLERQKNALQATTEHINAIESLAKEAESKQPKGK